VRAIEAAQGQLDRRHRPAGFPAAKPLVRHRHAIVMKPSCQVRKPSVNPATAHALARLNAGAQRIEQPQGPDPAQRGRERFRRDDDRIRRMVQRPIGDGAAADGRARPNRVHGQHVADELEIGAVVGDVAERDEAGEDGDRCDHAIFARRVISMGVSGGTPATRMKDDARYFANSRIASSASTPPVIEIGA
jgi:hypothetical protein